MNENEQIVGPKVVAIELPDRPEPSEELPPVHEIVFRPTNPPLELIAAGTLPVSAEKYANENAIMRFGLIDAMELISNRHKLIVSTNKLSTWIKNYNAAQGVTSELSGRIQQYLSIDPESIGRQNILLHEAQHLVALPEDIRDDAQIVIFPFGSLTRFPENMDDWDAIPLYISQIGGITLGVSEDELTPEQEIEVACAPDFPSLSDLQKADQALEKISPDDPKRTILQALITQKKATGGHSSPAAQID